jgi:hypothetical protein
MTRITGRRKTMTSIDDLWLEIAGHATGIGAFRLMNEAHPLDLYGGIDHEGRRALMLVTEFPPRELPIAGIIEVTLNQRNDGLFAMLIRLSRPEFQAVFGRLCMDLIDGTRDCTRRSGTEALLRRLNRWRKLLEAGPHEGLNNMQLRGLFGELWFLRNVAIPRFGLTVAVEAWNGPLDAPQDFQLGDGLVEIKTILPGAHIVSITSADQLESATNPLQLAVVVTDISKGVSVPEVVEDIRREIEGAQTAAAEFDLRLAEAGYSNRDEYATLRFTAQEIRYYSVGPGFPRIITSLLPQGISRVTYDLDLLKCGAYQNEYINATDRIQN